MGSYQDNLNLPDEEKRFKGYREGRAITMLHRLRKQKRKALSVSRLMQRRVDVLDDFLENQLPSVEQVKKLEASARKKGSVINGHNLDKLRSPVEDKVLEAWWNEFYTTADAILTHPDGRVKLVLDAYPLVKGKNWKSLRNGDLVLPDGYFDRLKGNNVRQFSRRQLQRYAERLHFAAEARKNPMWRFLARKEAVLDSYIDAVFVKRKRWKSDTRRKEMPIYVTPSSVPTLRFWNIFDIMDRSSARGTGLGRYAHMVGER